ncbi:molybdopterin synthase catalytic subunit MoaE [Sulfuriferula thiophila]|uniref:molybdopterin synthase catalytic subunit MoaE n=1 Tax=Sulfuriferula thiophila TaxID=1781211 RepID=UPI000F60755D|nr:molybdopterin synthase catalytic subunit MoaE [Sulfuriferula thiophila]
MKIAVQTEDFDLSSEVAELRANQPQIGAVASFVGLVRDINDGSSVAAMSLEHYPAMTEKALREIVAEATQRWQVIDATIIHRIGDLYPSDQIVLVAVASMHRHDAFATCEFIMDYLKTRAPFWKKELTPQGARWVDARETDETATQRWSKPDATPH